MNDYLQVGMPIKLEVEVVPPYLSFWGAISKVNGDELTVKIDGHYAQNEVRRVKCTIPKDTKACIFETFIIKGSDHLLILKMPLDEDLSVIQRRKYVRASVDLPVNCYLIGINDQKVESHKLFPAVAKDISGGGILLNSSLSLPTGTIIVFELELSNQKLLLTAKVLRNTENAENKSRDLGCEFLGIDETDRQRIISYCTKMQIQKKRR